MKPTVIILLTMLLVIPISCKTKEVNTRQDTIQMVNELKGFHKDYLLPHLGQKMCNLMDCPEIENHQLETDMVIKGYIINSSNVYISLCDIYIKNYQDEEIRKMIDPILEEIMKNQLSVLNGASIMVSPDLLKYLDKELDYIHQIGDAMEADILKKYYKIF